MFADADANSAANLADYWLPLLALFTGARKGELAKLRAEDVAKDDATGCYMLSITEDKHEGKSLKTASSWRTVPVHPELTRLGFLDLVEAAKVWGDGDWLLPTVSTARGLGTWGERFGRTLEKLGKATGKGCTRSAIASKMRSERRVSLKTYQMRLLATAGVAWGEGTGRGRGMPSSVTSRSFTGSAHRVWSRQSRR